MKTKTAIKGFTLVEILIVVGIIVVLFGGIAISSYTFKDQMAFSSAINSLKGIADEAKNYSLSTLSYPDIGDKDNDTKECDDPALTTCDRVLPNGYILNIDTSGETVKVSLYADVLNSTVNALDASDQLIRSVELSKGINVSFKASTKTGAPYGSPIPDSLSILYTQTNAEFYVLLASPAKLNLQIDLTQTDSKGTVMRRKFVYFHNLNNTAQITDSAMIE